MAVKESVARQEALIGLRTKMVYSLLVLALFMVQTLLYAPAAYAGEACDNPRVLFEYRHVNFAWQPVNYGWFIDAAGEVKRYRLTGAACREWKTADQDGYITKCDLAQNYQRAVEQIAVLDSTELGQKTAGMDVLLCDSELSQPVSGGYDRGDSEFVCYLWDSEKGQYKRILLAREGDFSQKNLHPKAVELVEWLSTLNKEFTKK